MKKIVLILLILTACLKSFSQHPIGTDSLSLQTLANSNTLVKSKGAIGSDSGFISTVYPDTTSANYGKIKNYPGAQIRVGDTIWLRNYNATKWLNLTAGISAIDLTWQNTLDNSSTLTRNNFSDMQGNDFFFDNGGVFTFNVNDFAIPYLATPQGNQDIFVGADEFGNLYKKQLVLPVDSGGFSGTQDWQSTIDHGNRMRHHNTVHFVNYDWYMDSLGNTSEFSGQSATFDNQVGAYTEKHQDSANAYLYAQDTTGIQGTEMRVHPDSAHMQAWDANGNNTYFTLFRKGTTRTFASVADTLDAPVINFPQFHNLDSSQNQINIDEQGNFYWTNKASGTGGASDRFALEDVTGVHNRYINMNQFDLWLDSINYLKSNGRANFYHTGPTNNSFDDRMFQINDTVSSDNATADRYPRALFSQLVTSGSTNFNGPTEELIALQGQTTLNSNIITREAVGLLGRTVSAVTNTTGRITGLEGEITVHAPAVQTTTQAVGLESTFFHLGGTLNARNYYYFRSRDTNENLIPTTLNVDTAYGFYMHDFSMGTMKYGFYQAGSGKTNHYDAVTNQFPNLPAYSTGGNRAVVLNTATNRLELASTSLSGSSVGAVDSIFTIPAVYTDTVKYTNNGNTYTAALIDHSDDRLYGLNVTSGGGLTLNVTSGGFRLLDGNRYTSAGGSTTLATADPSLPRKDVIYVDNTGAIGHITGTAATNPTTPQVDPVTQLFLTEVSVDAGATSLSVTTSAVYDEPATDAFTGTNTGVTVNYTNTSSVQHLTQSADVGSWTTGQTITFTKNTGTLSATDYSSISGFIKLKSSLANTANIRVSFLNGTTVVSNVITLAAAQGFSKTVLTYQNIAIPMSSFTFSSTTFNKIRITLAGTGGGFYLDYVQLQNGTSQSSLIADNGSLDTVNVVNVSDYVIRGGFGTDTTKAVYYAMHNNPTKKIIHFTVDASPYVIQTHYRTGSSSDYRQGIQTISNQVIWIDKGVVIYADTAWTATTSNAKFYPLINNIGDSNVTIINDGELIGQGTTFGNLTLDPNTNPNGFYTDSTHRWSTSGIQAKDCYNIEIKGTGSIHDFQMNGIFVMNSQKVIVHDLELSYNYGSGITSFVKSSCTMDNLFVHHNTSDGVRFDSVYYANSISNSQISWSGHREVGSTNGFAGIYCGGDTKNVMISNNHIHDNQSYGYDGSAAARYVHLLNNNIEYNGNGAIVTSGYLTVTGGILKNNGKRTDGTTDGVSNYNNAGIVVNSAVFLNVSNVKFIDTATGYQDYAVKSWGGGGSNGFNFSTFTNNTMNGVADTAHLWGGNAGTNNITQNLVYTITGVPVLYGTSGDALVLQSNGTWKPAAISGGSGVTTMAAIGSSPNANGATISSTTLNLEPASASFGGVVTTASQTFAGVKTFPTPIFTTSAQVPLIIGGTGTTSTLTLQPTSGVGTTNADIVFKNGNNGATEIGRWNNAGMLRIGASTSAAVGSNDKLTIAGTTYGYMSLVGSTASSNVIAAFAQGSGAGTSGNRFYTIGVNGSQTDAGYGGNTLTSGDYGLVAFYSSAFRKIWSNTQATQNMIFYGNVGFAGQTPTAYAHFPAGVSGTAPIQFTAGTKISATVSGTLETDINNDLYYTNGTATRAQVALWGYIAKSSSYTATDADNTIEVTATGQTITLPTAVGISGRVYTIVYTAGSGSTTIATTGNQQFVNITSAPITLTLNTPASAAITSYTVQSNGANWLVVSKVKNE